MFSRLIALIAMSVAFEDITVLAWPNFSLEDVVIYDFRHSCELLIKV
jgi:hypothetical protein